MIPSVRVRGESVGVGRRDVCLVCLSSASTRLCAESQRENLFKVTVRTPLLETRSQREERRMKHSLLHFCDSEEPAESGSNCSYIPFLFKDFFFLPLFHLLSSMLVKKRLIFWEGGFSIIFFKYPKDKTVLQQCELCYRIPPGSKTLTLRLRK